MCGYNIESGSDRSFHHHRRHSTPLSPKRNTRSKNSLFVLEMDNNLEPDGLRTLPNWNPPSLSSLLAMEDFTIVAMDFRALFTSLPQSCHLQVSSPISLSPDPPE